MRFRIGVHVGDVMVRGGDLFGDGVNIAARLQGVAEPAGVCISGEAHQYARSALSLDFDDLGQQTVKNVEDGERAYALKAAYDPITVGSRAQKPLKTITSDYWTHGLVSGLETTKARAPAALAFRAAQVVLGTRALFSDQLLQNLLEPSSNGKRAAREAHHLFPTTWLRSRGIEDRRRINQVANFADVGWHENSAIGGQGPAKYVPRLREKLAIDDHQWGRMCAEHALPPSWESMDYEEFLSERRRRMADIIRVAFRQLGGEPEASPLTPPWFLPGAEEVWQRISETERALRAVVREVYVARFGDAAARRIEEALPDRERESLNRALRARPAGSEPLTNVDYLYLGQLPTLLFSNEAWQHARQRFGGASDTKQRLQSAVGQIAPVRNEIAHVREVDRERLLPRSVACAEVLQMLRGNT